MMRTENEITEARAYLVRTLVAGSLSEDQRTLLRGMSVALQWVCGDGGSSLQRLLEGEPISAPATQGGPAGE